jgi:hypothetical protein
MRRCREEDFKELPNVDETLINRLCPDIKGYDEDYKVKNTHRHLIERNSFAIEISACNSLVPNFCIGNETEIDWVINNLYFTLFTL